MLMSLFFFFFNDTATTEIYTLSLHDALPIFPREPRRGLVRGGREPVRVEHRKRAPRRPRGQRREGRARGRALRMARVLHAAAPRLAVRAVLSAEWRVHHAGGPRAPPQFGLAPPPPPGVDPRLRP